MKINSDSKNIDIKQKLYPLLKNNIFHITKYHSYKSIIKDGFIYSNINNKYSYTIPQSEKSYGRKNNYICLVDLRFVTKDLIEKSLYKYYFYSPFYDSKKYVFMILSSNIYSDIITQNDLKDNLQYTDMYVPGIECWYPNMLSIKYIKEVIIVNKKYTISDYIYP